MIKNIFKKYWVEIILWWIISYIWILLFYNLWLQSFWIDEWYSSYVAKYMSIEWLYKSSYFLFEWLQALSFKLWWIDDFWARFPSVIAHLISVLLMYLIPTKICKNKYIGLLSALIFWLLYWELWWWRDARFYSLLQLMLLLEIFLMQKWADTKKTLYLNLGIILSWLWMIFHPFLYCLWAILVCIFLFQYKKLRDFKTIFSKKYLSTRILVIVWLAIVIFYGTLWGVLKWSLSSGLSLDAKKYYFMFYAKHLWTEMGMITIFGVLWMSWFILKKRWRETIFFVLPFILFIYALVIKWYLMHSRYALLMFPLMILSSAIAIFDIFKFIKSRYEKSVIAIVLVLFIWFSAHFQILPKSNYYFDYTSPQPDFKSAYASIPSWSNVISWFPMLCDWYYSWRWKCINAIRVDLVHDGKTKITKLEKEKYTKIPYIDNLDKLTPGVYYFVIDNLTANSESINSTLYKQIRKHWKITYESWKSYKNIFVAKVLINR